MNESKDRDRKSHASSPPPTPAHHPGPPPGSREAADPALDKKTDEDVVSDPLLRENQATYVTQYAFYFKAVTIQIPYNRESILNHQFWNKNKYMNIFFTKKDLFMYRAVFKDTKDTVVT